MEQFPYWQRQTADKPLFEDIEWSKPEQRSRAGKLGIIGGNKLGFVSVGEAYDTALKTGVGYAKVLLPDTLKRSVPTVMTDVVFAPSNQSGGLNKNALNDMLALGDWADSILLIGDAGRNSETAIAYEEFISKYDRQLVITRDAVDLVINDASELINRENTILIVSFAQLQKIFTKVYYPKVLTFSMQLAQLVEALHKFTISYPATIVTFHQENIVFASEGEVVTMPWDNPMAIWRGTVAAQIAPYYLWNPAKPVQAATTAVLNK